MRDKAFWEAYRDKMNARECFLSYNGIRLAEVAENYAVVEGELSAASMNRIGIPHGGLLFTLADEAAGMAASTGELAGLSATSHMDFLRSAGKEARFVRATARLTKGGRRLGFFAVEVRDDLDNLLATGSFTMCYVGENPVMKELEAELS